MRKINQALIWLAAVLLLNACSDSKQEAAGQTAVRIEQVARVVAQKQDRVTVMELARWVIEERNDFLLIDVRPGDDFAAGHIAGAENISLPQLVSSQYQQTLPNDRKLVLYSQGSEIAAQAAVLLRLSGYDANLLLGGYNFWSQHVLNPDIHPTQADGEYPRVAERQAIACYFVGGGKSSPAPVPVQSRKRSAPAFVPPVSRPAVPLPEMKDEGC